MGGVEVNKVFHSIELSVPPVPSFLDTTEASGVTVAIEDVADSQLKKLGTAWTNALVAKAQKLRKEKGQPSMGTQL